MSAPRPLVWHLWKDEDPTSYGFNWKYVWVRARKGGEASIIHVEWRVDGGKLVASGDGPYGAERLFYEKRGWWAGPIEAPAE